MPDHAKQQKLSSTSFVYPVKSLLEGRIQPHSEAATSPGPGAPEEPPSFFNFIQDTRRSPGAQVDVLTPPPGPLGEISASFPESTSRAVDFDKPNKRRTRKRSSNAASAVLDPDTPRTGNDSEPIRVHKSRRRKSARKPSPNFSHFPAGDKPYVPRSFSTINDQSTPTSSSGGNMETVPTTMSAAYFLGHRNSTESSTPPTMDIETPDILNIDKVSPSWFVDEPLFPFNPSEYGLVHLPPISLSESGRTSSTSSKSQSKRSAPSSDTKRIALGSMAPITSGLVSPEPANSSSAKNDSSQGSSQDSGVSNTSSLASDDVHLTFKFQYHQDENGHHVIVGREGKLQCCEDEVNRRKIGGGASTNWFIAHSHSGCCTRIWCSYCCCRGRGCVGCATNLRGGHLLEFCMTYANLPFHTECNRNTGPTPETPFRIRVLH